VLELPISVKLFVKHIDYKSQVIQLFDPDYCFPRQLQWLNLSSTPFRFEVDSPYHLSDYALFNCSPRSKDVDYHPISCLSRPTYQVYPATSITVSLISCTKMYNLASIPYGITGHHEKYVQLNWPTPACGDCEVIKGNKCVRSNHNGLGTQCISISTFSQLMKKKKRAYFRLNT
jgi:hypothetical protein